MKTEAQLKLGSLGLASVVKHYERLMEQCDGDVVAVELILDEHDFFWQRLSEDAKQQIRVRFA
tara:strand:+ start:269 stop:457 length:189 start_codon:yes stop_codon:yes gene_type:complete